MLLWDMSHLKSFTTGNGNVAVGQAAGDSITTHIRICLLGQNGATNITTDTQMLVFIGSNVITLMVTIMCMWDKIWIRW